MDEPTRYPSTALGLDDMLASGRTGCLVSESRPRGPRVYTMLGQVMAVVSQADGERGLSRLVEQGRVEQARAGALRRAMAAREDGLELLAAEVSGSEMARLRQELLQANLADFCRLPGPAWFEPMTQLFVPGMTPGSELGSAPRRAQTRPPSPVEPPTPVRASEPSISESLASTLSAFEDHDRLRSGGGGEFTVDDALLEVVDLGPEPEPVPRAASGIRFAPAEFSAEQLSHKVGVCNQVLQTVLRALEHDGHEGQPLLREVAGESDTEFQSRLRGVRLDARGLLSLDSLHECLAMRPSSEHRRMVEHGLLDLMERALDLCAEQLSEPQMDEVLESVSGFHQRLKQ